VQSLKNPETKISGLSEVSGYLDTAAFRMAFKALTNAVPKTIRRLSNENR
jgi:AraC-like DNA-binding protein